MEAVRNNRDIHLFVFGSIGDEVKERFDELLSENMTYLGWLSQEDTYAALKACDAAVFPGRHSVIWEQCVGLGVPLVIRKWPGTTHVDIGGNCVFLENGSVEELNKTIGNLLNRDYLKKLKENAKKEGRMQFSYKNIAEKSVSVSC